MTFKVEPMSNNTSTRAVMEVERKQDFRHDLDYWHEYWR